MEETGHNHDVLAGIMADTTDLDQLEAEVSRKDAAEIEKNEEKKRKERTNSSWTSTSSKHGRTDSTSSTDKDKKQKMDKPKEEKKIDIGKEGQKDCGEGLKPISLKSSIVLPRTSSKGVVRYFVIKSFTHKHLEISIQKSIWSTQSHNEQKLNEAYENSEVILIFSVNNSRHFQGYARMTSRIGKELTNIWSLDGGTHFGGVFRVEWITLFDLPFSETLHIRNPLNSNKPVKISRDGQELTPEVGQQLCGLLEDGSAAEKKEKVPFLLLEMELMMNTKIKN